MNPTMTRAQTAPTTQANTLFFILIVPFREKYTPTVASFVLNYSRVGRGDRKTMVLYHRNPFITTKGFPHGNVCREG
jgi:hypothetical protein